MVIVMDLVDGVVDVIVSVEDGEGNCVEILENFLLGEINVVFSVLDFVIFFNIIELVVVVLVWDLIKFVLILVNLGLIMVSFGFEYIDFGYNVVDNVDGDIIVKVVLEGVVDIFSLVNYLIIYIV